MLIAISVLAKILFAIGFALFLMVFYQQTMLVSEWYEDHAPAGSWVKRALLSTEIIFYPSLSKRCRRRRHRLIWALAGAFGFGFTGVFLQRLVDGQG